MTNEAEMLALVAELENRTEVDARAATIGIYATPKMWADVAGILRAATSAPDAGLVEREASIAWREFVDLAIETVQNVRSAGAGNFKEARYQGQRGADHADALYDAQKALHAMLPTPAILALLSSRAVAGEPVAWPDIPDDDADFTPDLARKIIAKYQSLIPAPSGRDPATRPTFTVPDGFESVRDDEGQATGEVRRMYQDEMADRLEGVKINENLNNLRQS